MRWYGDITCITVGSAWLQLATAFDICSRKVVGWSIAERMRTSLVADAVEIAMSTRGGQVDGVVFHTDRGAQNSAAAFAEVRRLHGIRRSMGCLGSCCDCEDEWVPLRAWPAPSYDWRCCLGIDLSTTAWSGTRCRWPGGVYR
ncbi:DDE-type integrase/transposase/recombinase [Streptomyces syringium]|uniref:DDE-type integrase/transposase/recombinase n=1 Tax=Streptomyces syringium TaxID=76729 RepID=UPI00345370B6